MSLTVTEEALVRQLIDQQAAILSLASSESTIISKLGATKVTIADLVNAATISDSDLFLIRQGTTEKNVTGAVVKALASAGVAGGTETTSGILELATAAETVAGTDNSRAIHPAGFMSGFANSLSANGYQKLPSGIIIQWGTTNSFSGSPYSVSTATFPIVFPNAVLARGASSTGASVSCATGSSLSSIIVTNSTSATSPAVWFAIGY